MLNKTVVSLERIVAKIDNDFNPDTSDWIPRVAAWAIEAMQMLKVLPTERKKVKVKVHDRIAYSECTFDVYGLKVFDENGCEIKVITSVTDKCACTPTGDGIQEDTDGYHLTPQTVDIIDNPDYNYASNHMRADTINSKDYSSRYNVKGIDYVERIKPRTYTIIDDNKIELNFDTKCIIIEYNAIKTCKSLTYNCDVPMIPNNGLLIEAIGMWCMYKMLCRGYKHPVFNLAASQYGTNPYYIWNQMKEEVKRSIIIDAQGNIQDGGVWRSAFYNFTFNPRD